MASKGYMRSLAYEGSASLTRSTALFPCRPILAEALQHDAGTERYLTRFLVRQEYTANDEPRVSCGVGKRMS